MQVLQEMLDMLHEHENQVHAARLEIIVIWLIGKAFLLRLQLLWLPEFLNYDKDVQAL